MDLTIKSPVIFIDGICKRAINTKEPDRASVITVA